MLISTEILCNGSILYKPECYPCMLGSHFAWSPNVAHPGIDLNKRFHRRRASSQKRANSICSLGQSSSITWPWQMCEWNSQDVSSSVMACDWTLKTLMVMINGVRLRAPFLRCSPRATVDCIGHLNLAFGWHFDMFVQTFSPWSKELRRHSIVTKTCGNLSFNRLGDIL